MKPQFQSFSYYLSLQSTKPAHCYMSVLTGLVLMLMMSLGIRVVEQLSWRVWAGPSSQPQHTSNTTNDFCSSTSAASISYSIIWPGFCSHLCCRVETIHS